MTQALTVCFCLNRIILSFLRGRMCLRRRGHSSALWSVTGARGWVHGAPGTSQNTHSSQVWTGVPFISSLLRTVLMSPTPQTPPTSTCWTTVWATRYQSHQIRHRDEKLRVIWLLLLLCSGDAEWHDGASTCRASSGVCGLLLHSHQVSDSSSAALLLSAAVTCSHSAVLYRETGALDRSRDIMMEINQQQDRDLLHLQGTLVRWALINENMNKIIKFSHKNGLYSKYVLHHKIQRNSNRHRISKIIIIMIS